MKDLVIFPEIEYPFVNTGEGGMAVFFVLLKNFQKDRQKCSGGNGLWPVQDVVVWPPKYMDINSKGFRNPVDLIMLVASTKMSLWDERKKCYWHATEKDLIEEGKILFDMIERIYGQKPDIVTLLDT